MLHVASELLDHSHLPRCVSYVSLDVVADSMKEDARKMVLTMVDMERSYLTADVFRDIISQNGATDGVEQPHLLRTLSGVWPRSICLLLHVFSYWQHVSVGCVVGAVRVRQDDMLPCVWGMGMQGRSACQDSQTVPVGLAGLSCLKLYCNTLLRA